jgi:radical SAM superfamily enzyme YgiQ (UPF0313 family)
MRWETRSPEDLVAEMKAYLERYGVTHFALHDLAVSLEGDWMRNFARLVIDEQLGITWELQSASRSEVIDASVADLLYRSGCRRLSYTPESGSPSVLRRLKKKIHLGKMLRSIHAASSRGIEVTVNITLGFPDETLSEMLETYAFIAKLPRFGASAVSVRSFRPEPGSELFDRLVVEGKITPDDAFFDDLVVADDGRIVSNCSQFSTRELEAIVVGAQAIFYGVSIGTHPGRAFSLARGLFARKPDTKALRGFAAMRAGAGAGRRIVSFMRPSSTA